MSALYTLRDEKAAIDTLISQLAKKGLAGLAVTPESYIDELPECTESSIGEGRNGGDHIVCLSDRGNCLCSDV